ncbi:MAG: hypothetical protein IJU84_01375, partial [Clostridia bacterium]|nr:hypothetical protein [Clostridia bacterium]
MKRLFKSKIILLLVLGILALDISNDFPLVDIKETAIVVALGVDKDGEEYELSAQIAVPQATSQAASYKATVVSGKGRTPALALESVGTHTGWYVKLSFCNVIVLGKGIFDGDVMECLDYFIRTDKMLDTAELCATDATAKEILTTSTPLDDVSAFSASKILERDAESASAVSFMNLKEFSMGYYSESGFSLMPKIKTESSLDAESPDDASDKSGSGGASGEGGSSGGSGSSDGGESSGDRGSSNGGSSGGNESSGNGGGGSPSGSGEKNSGKKDKIFDANSTALFSKGVLAGELDDKETLVFNLILHKTNETSLLLHDADLYGKEADLMISLRDNSWKYRLRIEDGRPILHVYLKAKARLDDTSRTVSPQTLSTSYSVPDNVLKDLETKIESELTE